MYIYIYLPWHLTTKIAQMSLLALSLTHAPAPLSFFYCGARSPYPTRRQKIRSSLFLSLPPSSYLLDSTPKNFSSFLFFLLDLLPFILHAILPVFPPSSINTSTDDRLPFHIVDLFDSLDTDHWTASQGAEMT